MSLPLAAVVAVALPEDVARVAVFVGAELESAAEEGEKAAARRFLSVDQQPRTLAWHLTR